MRLALLVAVPMVLSARANARPLTAGVTAGETQSKADANVDANKTLGLFGRVGFTPRVSGQLELQRIQTDNQSADLRTATGLIVVDLGSGGHVMPLMLAGFGFDNASTSYGTTASATHLEGGFGLEYRAEGGLTIGADVRMGGRSLDTSTAIATPTKGTAYFQPSTLQDGEYRSARLTVGVRF